MNDLSRFVTHPNAHFATIEPIPHLPVASTTMPPMLPLVPEPPPFIEFINGTEFVGYPPPSEWLVPGMVPMNTVTLFGGDGGTGKSLLALQLAVSTAIGRLWLNRIIGQGSALYFSAEDDRDELHRRLATITRSLNVTMLDLRALTIADMAGRDALLASLGKKTGAISINAIFGALEAQICIGKPRLVILDTLADIFPGNENDRTQARQFIGLLRGLARRHRCAVVVLAHPSLTGIASGTGASGSTGWNNSVRSRLYFERIKSEGYESDPDARRLKVMKSNYGPVDIEILVSWKDGVFIAQQDAKSDETASRAERIFINLLERGTAQGRYFSAMRAPNDFAQMPGSEGLTKQILKRAMERLFTDEKIIENTIVENRRQRKIIAVSGKL